MRVLVVVYLTFFVGVFSLCGFPHFGFLISESWLLICFNSL